MALWSTNQVALELANVATPAIDVMVYDKDITIYTPVAVEASARMAVELKGSPDITSDVSAILAKRIDDELHIRLYPESVDLKVCLNTAKGDECVKGSAKSFDNDMGGEFAISVGPFEDIRSFSVILPDGQEYSSLVIPQLENVWEEQIGCESDAQIEEFSYSVKGSGDEQIAHVTYRSVDPTSALICGLDEARDNVCLWSPLDVGRHDLKIRTDASFKDVLLRDEKGCSIAMAANN